MQKEFPSSATCCFKCMESRFSCLYHRQSISYSCFTMKLSLYAAENKNDRKLDCDDGSHFLY